MCNPPTINLIFTPISRVSKNDYSWVTNLNLPKIRIEGIYTMKGRILILPLNGRGKCWLEPSMSKKGQGLVSGR